MKKLISAAAVMLAAIVMLGCGSGNTGPKQAESKGFFGKLPSIKAAYKVDDSTLTAKAKTEVKSMDDLVAMQSKINKLKEDAKAEFAKEVTGLGLPIVLPFADSTGNAEYVVKDAKITAIDWDRATIEATVEVKANSKKTMGGQVMQLTVPALMLDGEGKVIKDHDYDNWITLATTKEMKAGETHTVTGVVSINKANAALGRLVFKSYDAFKKAKGYN